MTLRTFLLASLTLAVLSCRATEAGGAGKPAKKVVLIAGPLDKGHPRGTHEYAQSVRLLKDCLDHSPDAHGLKVEAYFDGWPADPKTLDDAATIVLIASGADRNVNDHPLLVGDRLQVIERQMKRGCGLAVIHWGVFVPEKHREQFLDWIGGYFDYERGTGGPKNSWYSKIQTAVCKARPAAPGHPVCRGVEPFEVREEFYYHIRFRPGDRRLVPLLSADIPGEKGPQVVAWGVQRKDGGRGFGFTGGHFFANWKVDGFRKLVLNAILWTAGADVPAGGVRSTVRARPEGGAQDERPIKALILTGRQHPAHKWQDTTPALQDALKADPRFRALVVQDIEFLARKELHGFEVVLLNYCNWQAPGLSAAAKENFVNYLKRGGGLAIIHFANGAFHFSLPGAGGSDWPEWRTKICRRVWDHTPGKSGHDPYGPFEVKIAAADHPVTRGLKPYLTTDELYYRQQGEEPVEVLATARSRVTGKDEPMAMVYRYGSGHVFQTVLGHDAKALRTAGTVELIRRGAAWAAGRDPRSEKRKPTPVRGRLFP